MACASRDAALRLCEGGWDRTCCGTVSDAGRGCELEAKGREMAGRVGVMRVDEVEEMGGLVTAWLDTVSSFPRLL